WVRALPDLDPGERRDPVLDQLFDDTTGERFGTTDAVLVVQGGRLVIERYGAGIDATTTLPSWSMAKSILHALVGVLVGDGRLTLDEAPAWPGWSGTDDPRTDITLDHLLHMRSGLAWLEDYVDGQRSNVIEMLFGSGRPDVAAYAAGQPLAHPVDRTFCYSSGTSCIVSAATRRLVGGPREYEAFMHEALFDPIGMRSPIPKFDASGTWIGSSYCFATATDFARFGLLYLRDGVWDGRRVLPEGWVDHARTPQPDVDDEGWGYGAHWWLLPGRDDGLFFASGYRGQYTIVVPGLDLVVVRSGDSETEQRDAVLGSLLAIVDCFAG
ncbi:MAG: serine hydrolase domain-containing protein, partial [Acidimicrobiales bacterium]